MIRAQGREVLSSLGQAQTSASPLIDLRIFRGAFEDRPVLRSTVSVVNWMKSRLPLISSRLGNGTCMWSERLGEEVFETQAHLRMLQVNNRDRGYGDRPLYTYESSVLTSVSLIGGSRGERDTNTSRGTCEQLSPSSGAEHGRRGR